MATMMMALARVLQSDVECSIMSCSCSAQMVLAFPSLCVLTVNMLRSIWCVSLNACAELVIDVFHGFPVRKGAGKVYLFWINCVATEVHEGKRMRLFSLCSLPLFPATPHVFPQLHTPWTPHAIEWSAVKVERVANLTKLGKRNCRLCNGYVNAKAIVRFLSPGSGGQGFSQFVPFD